MTSANEATIRRHFEQFWNKSNVLAELFTDDYTGHGVTAGAPDFDVSSLPAGAKAGRTAFPDLRVTIEDLIETGDRVVVRYTLHGTHQGDYQGVAPTGNAVQCSGITIYRMADGKIAENWQNRDELGVFRQIGSPPAPAAATT